MTMCVSVRGHGLGSLAHTNMEAEKSHNVLLANESPGESGVQFQSVSKA
jgi:hypothetical protein